MFGGIAVVAMLVNIVIIICVIVFAVKLLNRLTDIAEAQKSVASSQERLVQEFVSQTKSKTPNDN